MIIVNKYQVIVTDKNGKYVRSTFDVIASSEIEAEEYVKNDSWWRNEGQGLNHKKLHYPLTFKAEISNT